MTHAPPVQIGDLARLLETERRLGEQLRAARAEADVLVAQAQAAADRGEAALAAELEAEGRLADERLDREYRKREQEIAGDAQRQIEAYAGIPASRLRLAPALGATVTSMRRTLDERERVERLRLKRMRSSRAPHTLFKPDDARSSREDL